MRDYSRRPECREKTCAKRAAARGLCTGHYNRLLYQVQKGRATWEGLEKLGLCLRSSREHKTRPWSKRKMLRVPKRETARCEIGGCDRAISCRGYCHWHYDKLRAAGVIPVNQYHPRSKLMREMDR